MQPQTLPDQQTATIRVAFDVNAGIEALTFPADTTDEQITARLRQSFLAAEAIDVDDEFTVEIGEEVKVLVDGDVIEHASITRSEPKPAYWLALAPEPDYWLALADDLRQAADLFATLAGTPAPVKAALDITGAWPGNTDRSASALTDTVAAALDVSAYSHPFPAGDSVYKAGRKFAQLHVQIATYMPPEQSELEQLRARNAELEAQLAAGGAR